MATLKEKLKELTSKQHELAVWEAMYAHLDDNFVSKDGREAKLIKVPDCLEEIVSEATIDQVLQNMAEGPIKGLRDAIAAIEGQEISGGSNATKEP